MEKSVSGNNELYDYEVSGDVHNTYRFSTDNYVKYEIKFVPSSNYFEAYDELNADVFEMVISVADNPTGGRLPADALVAPTIFAIFEDFFLPKRHVIVFICESSDGRGEARFRKFGLWFFSQTATTDEIAKVDRIIADGNIRIYLSLLMSRLHPQRSQIVDMFMNLGEEEK